MLYAKLQAIKSWVLWKQMLRQHRCKIFPGVHAREGTGRKQECPEEEVQGHAVQRSQTGLEVAPKKVVPTECSLWAEMDLYNPMTLGWLLWAVPEGFFAPWKLVPWSQDQPWRSCWLEALCCPFCVVGELSLLPLGSERCISESTGIINFFSRGPRSKYFRLCWPKGTWMILCRYLYKNHFEM